MVESWYVSSGCVDAKELKPWFIITIGIGIQMLITFVVTFTDPAFDNDDAGNQTVTMVQQSNGYHLMEESKRRCALRALGAKIKNSKLFLWFKSCLLLWQFISVLTILILDIAAIARKMQMLETGWNRYKCMSAVLLSSSNAKTTFSYFGVLFAEIFKGMIRLDSQRYSSGNVPNLFDQVFLGIGRSKFKMIFIGLCTLMTFVEMFGMFPFVLGGYFGYCWTWIVPLCGCCCFMTIIAKILYGKEADLYSSVLAALFPAFWTFTYIVLGLSAINFVSGIGYLDSIKMVVQERHWTTYIQHVASGMESKFRFFTMIF